MPPLLPVPLVFQSFPQLSFYLLLQSVLKENKIEQKTIESICYCFSPSPNLQKKFLLLFKYFIIFISYFWVTMTKKNTHKPKKKKPQGKFQPILAGKLAEKSSHHCGKAAELAPFPFVQSGNPPTWCHPHSRKITVSQYSLEGSSQTCLEVCFSNLKINHPKSIPCQSDTPTHLFIPQDSIPPPSPSAPKSSPVSLRQGQTLSCVLCQYQVIQSQVHIKNISIPKVKRVQKGVPNARLKPGSANIKSCSSVSVPRAHSAVPNQPLWSCHLQATQPLSGWFHTAHYFPQDTSHLPGITNILGAPLHPSQILPSQLHALPSKELPSGTLTALCVAQPPRRSIKICVEASIVRACARKL